MSFPRHNKAILSFIPKGSSKPVEMSSKLFSEKRGFEWNDAVAFSNTDIERILSDKKEISFTSFDDAHRAWTSFFYTHEITSTSVAIYETGDECGLGLKAIKPIPKSHCLHYSGIWSFAENKIDDTSYNYVLKDKDNQIYGNVNGLKHRHYAHFAMHADEEEFKYYTFNPESVRKDIASSNMSMMLIKRPDLITDKTAPPLLLALVTDRKIEVDEPLVWRYSFNSKYFLQPSNYIIEKFFNRQNGGVIPGSCYIVNTYKVRILLDEKESIDFEYSKEDVENKKLFIGDLGNDKYVFLDWREINAEIKRKPNSRYLLFSKPEYINAAHAYLMMKLSIKLKGHESEFQIFWDTLKENGSPKPYAKALRRICTATSDFAHDVTKLFLEICKEKKIEFDINETAGEKQNSALDYAKKNNNTKLCALLVWHGAKENLKQEKGHKVR